ncbi:unnamed protein product [Pylaiella littoralis]
MSSQWVYMSSEAASLCSASLPLEHQVLTNTCIRSPYRSVLSCFSPPSAEKPRDTSVRANYTIHTKVQSKVGTAGVEGTTAAPVACGGLSAEQLRELIIALMHSPARIVQEVGHLLHIFCAMAAQVPPDCGGRGGGGGGAVPPSKTWSEVTRGAAGHRPSGSSRKKSGRTVLMTNSGRRGAATARTEGAQCNHEAEKSKAKALRCWAAKSRGDMPSLLQLLQPGGGAGTTMTPNHAHRLQAQARAISMEGARRALPAAGAALGLVTSVIDGVLGESSSPPASTVAPSSRASSEVGSDSPAVGLGEKEDHDDEAAASGTSAAVAVVHQVSTTSRRNGVVAGKPIIRLGEIKSNGDDGNGESSLLEGKRSSIEEGADDAATTPTGPQAVVGESAFFLVGLEASAPSTLDLGSRP